MDKLNGKNIPVTVTVATETEPTTVDGVYTTTDDGFMLEFEIGLDKFTIVHGENQTTVKAAGVMSYDITLCADITHTVLATPYGKVNFSVKTEVRKVEKNEDSVRVILCYVLSADGLGDMARSVDIQLRVKN